MIMKSSIQDIKKQMSSESGETIVETMVSVLITSLSLLLLATAIGASIRIIQQSKQSMDTRYSQESSMVKRFETEAIGDETGSYSITGGAPIIASDNTKTLDFYETSDGVALYKRGG